MIKDELKALILANFPHQPTAEQELVAQKWGEMLARESADDVFLLTGYAGTGKTSLVGALVRTLGQLQLQVVLLAPTGRAAKVFAQYSGASAHTIHRRIYRQKVFTPEMNNFEQGYNAAKHTLFIVDESSMIANEGLSGGYFGTGRLLDDLVHYVYAGQGCRLMLVGDSAQLPPVGEELSPALSPEDLQQYGLNVWHAELTQVVRQVEDSGILWNATRLRRLIAGGSMGEWPRLRTAVFPDVRVVPGDELIDALEQSYYHCGRDQTIVVTRSNKRANIYNNGIRARILDLEGELESGDRLMVAKNNYHWLPESFIANGDLCEVRRLRNEREFYGFRFADATLEFPDYDGMEVSCTVLLDTLHTEAPALTREQQTALFHRICEDYPEITRQRDLIKKVKEDSYYNALQIKYAYAVTCHKAQGGQWEDVYIDQGYVSDDMLTPDYYRWLYTALTRATRRVYLVNWPSQQILPSDGENAAESVGF
ncbi:MAG: AAA family ATPase [Bacteroidaceae bacterium]|nr:AAA family ATPase [Bacteroidaceae bacterium]